MDDERIAGRTRDEWARFGFDIWREHCAHARSLDLRFDDRPEPAKEIDRKIAEGIVHEAIWGQMAEATAMLNAEADRLAESLRRMSSFAVQYEDQGHTRTRIDTLRDAAKMLRNILSPPPL